MPEPTPLTIARTLTLRGGAAAAILTLSLCLNPKETH